MKTSVFMQSKLDFKQEPLFFGSGANIQEYADPKYPIFEKADNTMMSFFWRPEEVGLQKDRSDFKKMLPGEQFIFTANLKYQILLDSLQGRGPLLAFLPVITNPELEASVISWGFFEKLHSRSYTHIIRNLYANPGDVTDHILDIPEIIERAESIGRYYDDFMIDMYKWKSDETTIPIKTLMRKLYLALMCINILEGVRFYISFACNFAFGENKIMEGTAKIMSLIARDEAQHLALTQNILKAFRNGDEGPEWQQVALDCQEEAEMMYRAAADQEKMWAKFLFDNGSMMGLNANVLGMYTEYLCNKRMRGVGLTPIFQSVRNPIGWIDTWLNSKGVQEAPQETEKESYLVGAIDSDVADDEFDDMTL